MRLPTALAVALAACAASPPHARADDLTLPGGATVATFVHAPYDRAQHSATCKPWLRVFAADGRQLTKDLGGLYPHHRGLFVGWNQVRCGGKSFDFWHCSHGESQRVVSFRGDGMAQEAHVDWLAANGSAIVREVRTVTLRPIDASSFALDVALALEAADADVQLGGDPQHAGCQFRAPQQFAAAVEPVVSYLRPPTAHGSADDVWTGCAWIAATLPLAGGPVTVLRVEAADNPPATWSTRAYGRFGAMCTAKLTAGAPLRLRYRYVVAAGARDAAWCEAAAAAFRG
jgi:hypothetical protein